MRVHLQPHLEAPGRRGPGCVSTGRESREPLANVIDSSAGRVRVGVEAKFELDLVPVHAVLFQQVLCSSQARTTSGFHAGSHAGCA